MKCLVQILLLSVFLVASCLIQLSRAAIGESVQYLDAYATYQMPDCIRQFQERQANISLSWVENVTLCQITANKLKVTYDNDKQKERDELIAASDELCDRLNACIELEANSDFFDCHAEMGDANMLLITNIHMNAKKAMVDLEDRYSEAEKQRLSCYLEAEHQYLTQIITSHQELKMCLTTSKARKKK